MNQRENAQWEADQDLDHKDIRPLLYDIHDESNRKDRNITENLVHANKRIASLSAKIALKNESASQAILQAITQASNIQEGYSKDANEIAGKSYDLQGEVTILTGKIADLTKGLHDLAAAQNATNERVQERMDRLNRCMLVLTILGVIFGGIAAHLASQSFELDRESLRLQKQQSLDRLSTDPRATSAKQP